MPAMRWLIRKSAALVAAYAIALQALFSGFAPANHVGTDAIAVICSTDASGEHLPSAPQHSDQCGACVAACSESWALTPSSLAFASVVFANTSEYLLPRLDAQSSPKRHQPHASRAPPLFS